MKPPAASPAPLAHAALPAAGTVPRVRLDLLGCQTLAGLGSAQGVHRRGRFVYAFGDADTGIVREYAVEPAGPENAPRLAPTGRAVRLTQHGVNLLPHPTGLTHHPDFGTFLGDTVHRRGVIWRIDFDRALRDGCLDHAVINRCRDDLAVNGCRPEFVRYRGRPLVATSDYGPAGNEVRLYDPATLGRVDRTGLEGLLVARFPCGPWVQSLHWLDDLGLLVLVQNQQAGLRYRLTFVCLESGCSPVQTLDLPHPADELEGFAMLCRRHALLLSSSAQDNAWFADLRLSASTPHATPRAA